MKQIKLLRYVMPLIRQYNYTKPQVLRLYPRHLTTTTVRYAQKEETKSVTVMENMFSQTEEKTKLAFLDMIKIYEQSNVHRRGHVEFIYSALKHMEEYGVDDDVQVYRALIDVMPKGRFVPTNIFQAEFMHYPKQQQCIIDLLDMMEYKGVIPDEAMEKQLIEIFGRRGYPVRKYWRMMYWMPKFKNLSPWPLPKKMTSDGLELAKMAIARMSEVDLQAKVNVYNTMDVPDSIDNTWIVSGQSPKQMELLREMPKDSPIFIEGPHLVWLRNRSVNYFVMKGKFQPVQNTPIDDDDITQINASVYRHALSTNVISVHEQKDGTVLAMAATGTSTKDSLLSWIRILQKNGNEILGELPIVFKMKQPTKELVEVKVGENKIV